MYWEYEDAHKILVTKPEGKRPIWSVRTVDGRTMLKWVLEE
jgi:hypothetical protein